MQKFLGGKKVKETRIFQYCTFRIIEVYVIECYVCFFLQRQSLAFLSFQHLGDDADCKKLLSGMKSDDLFRVVEDGIVLW